jgi:L-fucose mutarotase/ribose pyranase (RbsD/FucU family)
MPSGLRRDPGIEVPATINIVNLVVEHRQDLILTDTQFVRVVALKRVLDSTNAPFVRRIDSVQRLFKNVPIFSDPSAARRDSLNAAKAVVREMTADIDDNIADAKDKVFAILSTPQKERAEQIEDKARKASESAGRGRL